MGAAEEDKYMTDNFWQYAIIRQKVILEHLNVNTHVKTYQPIDCAKVPKGNDLTEDVYKKGQLKSVEETADFKQLVNSWMAVSEWASSDMVLTVSELWRVMQGIFVSY